MELGAAGLTEQPFRTHGKPLINVSYASQQQALKVLEKTRTTPSGLSFLQGPPLSGKTTLLHQFTDSLPRDCSFAFVDGTDLDTNGLLESVLKQFGYSIDHSSTSELLAMLRVFALHQAATHEPPVLIIENAHSLIPRALASLAELAELRLRGARALKMVLVSNRSLISIIGSPEMQRIAKRLTCDFHLRPMTNVEATDYLHSKLRAAGSDTPEFIFPVTICTEIWRASGGWPGILDRIALLALAKADKLPVSSEHIEHPALPRGTWDEMKLAPQQGVGTPLQSPMLYVSLDGITIHELPLDKKRVLIGRAGENDIPLESKYISRHHALLVRHENTTFLMDLNSMNGTFVNSTRIANHVLIHDDVITIGRHRIKFVDPAATRRETLAQVDFADTMSMKTLEDMRQLVAQGGATVRPAQTEEIPAGGGA